MSKLGIKHVQDNYNFKLYQENWIKTMDNFIEKNGAWENRKNYNNVWFTEVK